MSSLNPLSPIQTTTPLTETPASDNEINERQIFLQFALIGDCNTGKTSILNQFTENRFNPEYRTTTAPSSYTAPQIIIDDRQTNKKYIIELQLWDTVGHLPSHIDPTNESLTSKKHPQSFTNTNVNTKSHKNTCVPSNTRHDEPMFLCPDASDMDLDLVSLFTEMDAKEAMEDCIKPPPLPTLSAQLQERHNHKRNTNKENINLHSNTTHMDYKTLCPNGYSSQSSPETVQTKAVKPILEILATPDTNLNSDRVTQTHVHEPNRFIFESIDALILVYDITDSGSLSNLNGWMQRVAEYTMESEAIPILLLGNKSDLDEERCVSYKEGRKFCRELVHTHKLFKEISAKNNGDDFDDIKDIFTELARICIDKDYEILQWISSDSMCSAHALSDSYKKPTYKRNKRSNDFFVKTCAHNFCSKQKEDVEDPMFCVVL